jgi:hypothetical protein
LQGAGRFAERTSRPVGGEGPPAVIAVRHRRTTMVYRIVVPLLAVLALMLCVSPAAIAADEKPHEGKVVKVETGKLTMTMTGDTKEHVHNVAADAKITLDGKEAKLEDLKKGFDIKVWLNEAKAVSKIEASSKAKT